MWKPEVSNALIVEGGAMRGVFSTGVLDGFLSEGFDPFDGYLGVSSGAGNIAAFLADMPGRNFRIFSDYSLRSEFIDFRRLFTGGHVMDLDWLWAITIRELRLDLATIYRKTDRFFVGTTDVLSGRAVFHRTAASNLEAILKASSAVPILYRGFPLINGRRMADGGLSDPIPVARAIAMGARKIMIIRSRPRDYIKKEGLAQAVMLTAFHSHPQFVRTLKLRITSYNKSVRLLRNPPAGISIVEICPPRNFMIRRLSRDSGLLEKGYGQGRSMASRAMKAWTALSE